MVSEKPIIIDGKDHLMGRLASVIAKCLLQGQRIVVVRCEQICISGNFYRYVKYLILSQPYTPRLTICGAWLSLFSQIITLKCKL